MTNHYFQSGIPGGKSSEQTLVEDLIIECLGIYGFEIIYIPRQSIKTNDILNEDVLNNFKYAYTINAYLSDVNGFQGEGSLLSKFGIEIRDTANFIISKRKWDELIARDGETQLTTRPTEGDILYFPLTQAYFEIRRVVSKNPFFQIGRLYVYSLECELYQYSSEYFDTGIEEIDSIAKNHSLDEMLVGNVITTEKDRQSQNEIFVDNSDILNFDANNPFGEPRRK